jgi:hypothetical protein
MIYLACPYSDPDPEVRQERFIKANKQAVLFMAEGLHVFSPISQCHPIAMEGELPTGWEYWKEYDERILSICDELCILTIPGWVESKGVTNEILIALKRNMLITVVNFGFTGRVDWGEAI